MPVLTVIAGPNGSGKSTLTELLIKQGISFGEYLNADDIARDLTGSPAEISATAQQVVRDRREAALAAGRDHAFETVMSHHSHIEYMQRARKAGFEVRLFFVATEDPAINLDRVANRVLHGGHSVPANRIVDRYRRCLDNLPAAIRAADTCIIFDNSSANEPLREIAILAPDPPKTVYLAQFGPENVPIWWAEVLSQIKPDHTFEEGVIA